MEIGSWLSTGSLLPRNTHLMLPFRFDYLPFRRRARRHGARRVLLYCLGAEKEVPDLAIEVVVTSGGIDKLAVYKKLGVVEVWFWKGDGFEVHHLRDFHYERIPNSELLPELDLTLIAEYVKRSDILEAALEFREQIRAIEI